MRCKPERADVPGASGPALAGPETLSSALRSRNYIIFSQIQSSFYRKKNLKKYKLLLCKIKARLSGASGRAGELGEGAGESGAVTANFKVFPTVNFDQCI